MDLSRDVEDYIKDTIDHSLGIPISPHALQKKLYAAQESQRRLREQYTSLVSRLKEKEQAVELARSEASINAQAVKRFVEENRKLSGECEDLAKQCKNWERECFLYHQDREALMDFGNESEERVREGESRVRELEEQVRTMSKQRVESDEKLTSLEEEERLVDSVLASFVGEEEIMSGRVFLEANVEDQSLLSRWEELKPSRQKAVSLVSMVKRIEKEKECLVLNLAKAEQEVELVCEQNRELDEENRKLLKRCSCSSSSHIECSAERSKSKKRKSPKMMSSSSPGSISDI